MKPRYIPRSEARRCWWCKTTLCHSCRLAPVDQPGDCGGWRFKLCPNAATRDHLGTRKQGRKRAGTVVACFSCNNRRGSLAVDEWLQVLESA